MHVPESPVGGANAANEQGSHGSSDPKVQKTISIIKDPTDGIRQVWKKSLEVQDSKPKLKDQVRDGLYSPIGKSLQAAIKAGQANTQGAVQKIRALLEDQGAKDRIDDCVRWLILMIAVKEAEFESSKEHRGKSQVPVQDDLIETETNIQILIARIVIEIAPHLAFKTSTDLKCRAKSDTSKSDDPHGTIKKQKSTPFHQAARKGNGKVIKNMIRHGLHFYESQSLGDNKSHPAEGAHARLLTLMTKPDPGSPRGSAGTALHLAAVADEGDSEALTGLLDFDTGLADYPDKTFEYALEDGLLSVVEQFFAYERLKGIFATGDNLLRALGHLRPRDKEDCHADELERRRQIVFQLMSSDTTSSLLDEQVIDKIIQLNLNDVWELAREKISPNIDKLGLLHRAVLHQNLGFVEKFLEEYPKSVTYRAPLRKSEQLLAGRSECYPLWHNNKIIGPTGLRDRTSSQFPRREKIRNVIVTATIKDKEIKKLRDLPDIFQDSSETVRELCFDLSRFNSRKYPVSDFVRSLINHSENPNLLSYEHTIKYAEFPALDLDPDHKDTFGPEGLMEHTEVFEILQWLRDVKKVEEIIQLKVPDRLVGPHNEEKIAKQVSDFKVEVLNWRFLDMAISIFQDGETRRRIKELHLYSSGKRAAISHWLSNEGIASLENLETLEIHVIKDVMNENDCDAIADFIHRQFHDFRIKYKRNSLSVNVTCQRWNPSHERLADLEEIAERAVPKLSSFIKKYRDHVQHSGQVDSKNFRPTRVAIIDNGILSIAPKYESTREMLGTRQGLEGLREANAAETQYMQRTGNGDGRLSDSVGPRNYKTLWSRIKAGRSFVDDGLRFSPWLFASDPHGTQMANVICAIDPLCELYVAQVTDRRSGITPSRVARAIKWAISQKVDVISMSFATLDKNPDLERACIAASNEGILMFASSHDEGSNVREAYPASLAQTITIAAFDDFGMKLRQSEQEFQYGISGEEIAAGGVPFLESDDRVSGSSVATAIATGLSSLILSCDKLAREERAQQGKGHSELNWNWVVCEHHFKAMASQTSHGAKHILLEKFGGIDVKLKDGLDINVREILEDSFVNVDYSK